MPSSSRRFPLRRVRLALGALLLAVVPSLAAQDRPGPHSVGLVLQGLNPQGEFAEHINFAGGIAGSYLYALDPQGIIAFRAELGYLLYGAERYRVPLGGGPLGLINVDVNTTNNIVQGGVGLQLLAPGRTVRPYAHALAGFSSFFTSSSVTGTQQAEAFASSTNYSDAGFAWMAGGGLYVPLSAGATRLQLDLGVRWVDHGRREYLRPDGISFEGGDVQLNPVRTGAQALQFHLGVVIPIG
jgi:hypothetical protein